MTTYPIDPLFDPQVIGAKVRELGDRLQREVASSDPLVIAILGGSVIFLADLIRTISEPLRFEFVHVHFYAGEQGDLMRIHYPLPVEVAGENILVVKDVVSSGVIESYLHSQLRQHGAREVRFAALIDMPAERKTSFTLDYGAFSIERSGTFVGYGLKHQGRYGNLPFIGQLRTPAEDGGGAA